MKFDIKKAAAIFAACIIVISVTACGKKKTTADYESETVIGSASENAAVIAELSDKITALTVDSIEMPTFSDMQTAISLCRDSVLNYLLTTKYSRFSGNTSVLQKAAKEYASLNITAAVGTTDFEGELYNLFNHGGNIRHSDTERFRYMPKIEAYIPAVQTQACTYSLDIVSIDETEHTYRMSFYCTRGNDVSPEYLAVFVKRDAGGTYIKSLSQTAGEKVNCRLTATIS